jgi:SCP-2 sterol transfer family protein
VIVPEAPEPFFTEFLPAFIEASTSAPEASPGNPNGAAPSGAPAAWRPRRAVSNAGVAVRVVGVGEWTLRVSDRSLRVGAGVAEDVALQLSLRGEDFATLVVEPMRRALAATEASSADANALAARSFWTRLGRFDEETVQLLRQQEGRILVRVGDEGLSRNVALTPGLQTWSLDSAECCIDCELGALRELQDKQKNPLDLFYEGQIRISGDAQIALALAGLFL